MSHYQDIENLRVYTPLYHFVSKRILPGTGIEEKTPWKLLAHLLDQFAEKNGQLLARRDALQQQIDEWHLANKKQPVDFAGYRQFLMDIGYLQTPVDDFSINTADVDPEIAHIAGPQLVVPAANARYAINAANARWGSLYDALYGTDVIPYSGHEKKAVDFVPERGQRVVSFAMDFLDRTVPLDGVSYREIIKLEVSAQQLFVTTSTGQACALKNTILFAGYRGSRKAPESILFKHHNLHIEICINRDSPVGQSHPAGISDVILESAITTIQDCEDSVAAVDAEDKTRVYENLLGLFHGDLATPVQKNGKTFTRTLNPDRHYNAPNGKEMTLPGRSLMFVRNVGHLMTTNAVLDQKGKEIPEGILDGLITALVGLHDLQKLGQYQNSRTGSLYIVKPKMHGPEEVTFTCEVFAAIEQGLGLASNTIKIGIMDEERRTSVNLKNCIYEARDRVVFINTGFLDRTGDEIHTSMEAGPMRRKEDMKKSRWIKAYEDNNVDIGLKCGFSGKAQIGKGMWAMPEEMANMLASKQQHPLAGANTAWVPSPTAATLHALHYHQVNVFDVQQQIATREMANVDDMLSIPLLRETFPTEAEIQQELENNCQGILGYVVRWIDQGIGCSTVPDINNTGLMEDRATLRISSQHIANWLHHELVDRERIETAMTKMAAIVDRQNSADKNYIRLADNTQGYAYQAAMELILNGCKAANGYTEPALHEWRRRFKAG